MKIAYKALMLILCLNLATWYLNQLNVQPTVGIDTPISPTDITDRFNATGTAEGWSGWAGGLSYVVGDVVSGLQFFFSLMGFAIAGFPYYLIQIGTPVALRMVVIAIWTIVWSVFVIEFISGRSIEPD